MIGRRSLIHTIVVAARLDAAAEVTLDELRIELICPAGAQAKQYLRHASSQAG